HGRPVHALGRASLLSSVNGLARRSGRPAGTGRSEDRFAGERSRDGRARLVGSRLARCTALPHIERAWDRLVRTWGQTPVGSLAADAGCSHRHLIRQFRTCIGLPPKKVAMLLRFNRSLDAVGQSGLANSPRKPYLEGPAPLVCDAPGARWAHI